MHYMHLRYGQSMVSHFDKRQCYYQYEINFALFHLVCISFQWYCYNKVNFLFFQMPIDQIVYSERYADDRYEYRYECFSSARIIYTQVNKVVNGCRQKPLYTHL
jgi:hypothetical protein